MADLDRPGFCRRYSDAGWKYRVEKGCCISRSAFAIRHDNYWLCRANRYGQWPGRKGNPHTGTDSHANADNHAFAIIDPDTGTNADTGTDTITFPDA
jgi:hypothetical protein